MRYISSLSIFIERNLNRKELPIMFYCLYFASLWSLLVPIESHGGKMKII